MRLSERMGLKDHLNVLDCMLKKVFVNLRTFGACEDVIQLTLALFQVILALWNVYLIMEIMDDRLARP